MPKKGCIHQIPPKGHLLACRFGPFVLIYSYIPMYILVHCVQDFDDGETSMDGALRKRGFSEESIAAAIERGKTDDVAEVSVKFYFTKEFQRKVADVDGWVRTDRPRGVLRSTRGSGTDCNIDIALSPLSRHSFKRWWMT